MHYPAACPLFPLCLQVGAIGFCMGGALTLCAAQHAGIDAANPFYGLPGPEICQVGAAAWDAAWWLVPWGLGEMTFGWG